MKLIVRTDDFGYNDNFNRGTMEAIDHGIITHVEAMLDGRGIENGLRMLRERPWISVGWHTPHWNGKPVLDPSKIPSLVDSDGRFKFRPVSIGVNMEDRMSARFDEALAECRAEVERCIEILGRAPDTTEVVRFDNPVDDACKQVCEEYGIAYNTAYKIEPAINALIPPQEQYQRFKIHMPNQSLTAYAPLLSDDPGYRATYNPVSYFLNDEDHLLSKEIAFVAWHAGYVDASVYYDIRAKDGRDYFITACNRDVIALCAPELKQWIIENDVELINHRDAIYGSRDYQNHLKVCGSTLYRA